MSFWEILDTLLLKPLQLIFEVVYVVANRVVGNPGLSIIVLSLFINFLVLPLYIRADAIQKEEHAIGKRLQKGVAHIKKTFSGDERMMMLQTYYRQNGYKPIYVLRSAVSLFLQIPFFIAAYRFLSNLQMLNGVPFGPIVDLSAPDGMLAVWGGTINVLPVIMTVINLISCVVYTKGSPLKLKIQLYAMALFFLIFLYNSPAGLVLYWALNNVFSLVKTIFYKLNNPKRVLNSVCSASGLLMVVYGLIFYQAVTVKRIIFFVVVGLLMQIPLFYHVWRKQGKWMIEKGVMPGNSNARMFLTGTLFLAVLVGALIPSAVIRSSPLEFVDITWFYHPLWFIVSSFCMALGIFVIWMGVFYYLAKPAVKVYFDAAIWMLSGGAIVNYMFFGKNMGILSAQLKYEDELNFEWTDQIWNMVVVIAIMVLFFTIYRKWRKFVTEILAVGVLALCCMMVVNITGISKSVENIKEQKAGEIPRFTLSKTGKNVIVFMLDRAMGEYVPYFLQEKPELKELLSGFTYYPNTISFGAHTNTGSPALFGGYEYTPEEINKRDEESLEAKHNEALKVMPVLFDQNGFEVVVCDPPYAGYQWIPDLSIYDEYPDIQSYITTGKFTDPSVKDYKIQNNKRNFFCYGILKIAPLCAQEVVYNRGGYNRADVLKEAEYSGQIMPDLISAEGIHAEFMETYNVLENLPYITDVVDNEKNTFLMLENNTTHSIMLLQEPEYIPQMSVNNAEYESSHRERFTLNGNELKMDDYLQVIHYQINMAALLRLGEWFDYMRENDVYDNTRIILVADHGYDLDHLDGFYLENGEDISFYYPLLMVKDFDSEEFSISEGFMTNGDVPAIALKDVIEEPVNPFTGKAIDAHEKTEHEQYVFTSHEWMVDGIEANNGNTFRPGNWYAVYDDMRDPDNWKLVAENTVLPENE